MPKLKPLQPPDSFHLQAAQGWLELGNHLEANEELENITAALRAHPDVLEVRWRIYAKAEKWDACLDIAKAITTLAPNRHTGWVNLSVSLHRLKRTQEAWDTLLPLAGKFPKTPVIHYDLACYACQLGNLAEAKKLLERAFSLDKSNRLKLMGLADPDLEPLWGKIGEL